MRVTIAPSVAKGEIIAPPSKSIAHRALICAALSRCSTIHRVDFSEDIEATLRCLQALGASVTRQGDSVTLGGLNPFVIPSCTILDCGESGSTLRFLLPLCLLSSVPVLLTGSSRLLERPLDVYEEICRQQNLMFVRSNDRITVCGPLSSGNYTVRGDLSSQFISGLMLALPLLRDNSIVEVTEPFESAPYTEITQAVQKDFGVCIDREHTRFTIRGHSAYDSRSYTVEGDYSNAAYFDALTMLGGDVKVFGLTPESPQGDSVYRHYFKQLSKGFTTIDLANTPDLGPILFAVAAAMGGAEFTGTARLRLKESDRLASMKAELAKFGIPVTIGANSVIIHNAPLRAPTEVLCGHNDHRIVMALSLLCTITSGQIDGAEAVAKSYPSYFDHLQQLGIQLQKSNVD